MDDCTHSLDTSHGATVIEGTTCVSFGRRQGHHHVAQNMYERMQVDAEIWLSSLANSQCILQQGQNDGDSQHHESCTYCRVSHVTKGTDASEVAAYLL